MNATDIMRQNIMINAIRDAAQGAAVANDSAAAAISYAVARAEAERRTTWRVMGEMALRTLPLLRNLFEALMYAVFPIVMLIALVAPKAALGGYLKALIWVQFWAPLYAVLHAAMTIYSGYAGQTAVYDGNGTGVLGLTMWNSGGLGEAMADMGYVAGYLSMSIPMISYMLVQQGGMMMASLAGGVMQGIQGIAARAADEATTGNISLGNNSQDNINWFKQDTSVMDNRGYGSSMGADGLQRMHTQHGQVLGNSPVSAQATEQTVSSLKAGHSRSMQAAEQHGAAYMDSLGAAQNDLTRFSQGINNGTVNSQGWDQTTKAEFNESWSEVEKLGEKFGQQYGLDAKTGVQALAYAQAGWEVPGVAKFFTGADAKVVGQTGVSANVTSQELFQAAKDFSKETGFSEAHSRAVSAGEKLATENREDVTKGLGMDVSATLAQTQQHQQNWQASQTEAQGYQAAIEDVNSRGGNLGLDLSGPLQDYLATHYGSHARAEEVQAKVRTNAATPAEVANLMTAVSQFGRDFADVYARGFTQSDLDSTYGGADKPQLDTSNVPGRGPLQTSHDQTAGRIQQQATDAGVSTIATVEHHAEAIQGGAQQEIRDQKDRLDHLRVETEMAGKERQGEIEPTAHASAAAEAARRTTEPLVNQIVDSQNAVHGNSNQGGRGGRSGSR